jgi:hypothetical protein
MRWSKQRVALAPRALGNLASAEHFGFTGLVLGTGIDH